MPTTLAMNLPFGSVLVAVNESLKLQLGLANPQQGQTGQSKSSSLLWYFLTAGVSGAVASAATQPLDVVKTRLQTQDLLVSTASSSSGGDATIGRGHWTQPLGAANARPKYTGFTSAVATIVREEGWQALYNGLSFRMLQAIPAAAMCWGSFETVKSITS
jgi:solute carrier family 25 iron transporter 28/37